LFSRRRLASIATRIGSSHCASIRRSGFVIASLLGIDERKGGGGALAEQDSLAGFLGQRTGKGISVGETPETLLKEMNELVDVQGFAAFSKYLHGKVNERLTSSSLSAWQDRFGLRLSPELPNSTQLTVELEF
jgi:hypothetical protein